MTEAFTIQLQRRTARSGAMPLITYYDESRGERIELSGVSFANWVDKTAGLLTDEILVEPGDRVRLTLATTHPAHWVTLVWVAASWRARCVVTLDSGDDAAVEVIGPQTAPRGDPETVACSLHPFGLGSSTALPTGVIDYGIEVRGHPDSFTGPHPSLTDPAWADDERRLDHADVITWSRVQSGSAEGDSHGSADASADANGSRILVTPDAPWPTIHEALIKPVLGGGSAVVVVGADPDRLPEIAAAERVQHSSTEGPRQAS